MYLCVCVWGGGGGVTVVATVVQVFCCIVHVGLKRARKVVASSSGEKG